MRIITWNILEGFHYFDRVLAQYVMDETRLNLAKSLISRLSPDILVLNEALWCSLHNEKLMNYAEIFGFPYSYGHIYDGAWGNIILSRFPITETNMLSFNKRSAIVVVTNGIKVVTYHPHPLRSAFNKGVDFKAIADSIGDFPAIISGDFNMISPNDSFNSNILVEAFSSFSKTPDLDVERFVDSGKNITNTLTWSGFQDSLQKNKLYTIPTDFLSMNKNSGMRLDFIFHNNFIKNKKSWIVEDKMAEYSSDHRPVVMDFDLIS